MSPRRHSDPAQRRQAGECCPSQSEGGVIGVQTPRSALATLLAGHALRHGEIVHLAIKPSRWFILLSGLKFIAVVLILAIAAAVVDARVDTPGRLFYWEVAMFLICGRLTWAVLQWVSRLYILTDQRIMRIQGVFELEVFDSPLRRVTRVDVARCARERIFRLGTIVINTADAPAALWTMIRQPGEVHARIIDAIARSQHNSNLNAAA